MPARHNHFAIGILLTCVGAPLVATAQQPPEPPPASQPAARAPASAPASAPIHWAQRLGMRSAQITQVAKVVDRVVLVPDAATYLDEMRKWSPDPRNGGRWPVLFEDDILTPLFVRRFKPAEVIRRDAVAAPLPDDLAQRRHAIESVVVSALGGDPATQSIHQLFDIARYAPPGVVVASTKDPTWTAAVALAAGHAQPIIWIDDDLGTVHDIMDDATARRLAGEIASGIDALHYSYHALGDDIDAVTLCRNMPVAGQITLPDNLRLMKSGNYADGATALTDFLARNADGSPYAYTGWIFGDDKRAAYLAMCSLFLPHDSATLLNAYASEGEWGQYSMNGAANSAADILTQAGLTVQSRGGAEEMGEAGWRRFLVSGLSSDVVWMNSGGNNDFFVLNGGQARPGDVPVLNQPAALHLIHSWSLKSPARSDTVGGRWLEHGAYAMVGSCFEPFLATFMPPQTLAARCMGGVPFLVAARYWPDDQRAKPWRIVTIGDPLMLIPPVRVFNAPRIARKADYGENLLDRAKTLMKQASDSGDAASGGAAFAESIRLLDLLNQDDIALQMWALAQQKGIPSGRAASAALSALFRKGDAASFLQAWNVGGPRNAIQYDMLWDLMTPRLAGASREDLMSMESAIRPDMPAFDVDRLAPHLLRVGKDHFAQFIRREIEQTKDPEQQRQLREVAGKY